MDHDDPLRRTLTELATRIQDEVGRLIDSLTLEAAAAERRGRDRFRKTIDALALLDGASSLTVVLEALTESAQREAGRAAVFVARGTYLESWRFAGFLQRPDLDGPLRMPLDAAGALAAAVRSHRIVTVPGDEAAPGFARLAEGHRGVAIPLTLAGHPVAVLYADQGGGDALVSADAEWHLPLVLLASHASRCLESITALGAARYVADQAGWPAGPTGPAARPTTAAPSGEGQHELDVQAAHRYARLLVSEIKLYHEDSIAIGRRERDLLTRLGGEIARAQALYDERVPHSVRRSTDFFRAELEKTLAEGDGSLLETSN